MCFDDHVVHTRHGLVSVRQVVTRSLSRFLFVYVTDRQKDIQSYELVITHKKRNEISGDKIFFGFVLLSVQIEQRNFTQVKILTIYFKKVEREHIFQVFVVLVIQSGRSPVDTYTCTKVRMIHLLVCVCLFYLVLQFHCFSHNTDPPGYHNTVFP